MDESFNMQEVIQVLHDGGIILYPTDTIWGIGCDATNARAVEKIYRFKVRDRSKSLIILVENMEVLSNYVQDIPDVAVELMERIAEPLTIIYPHARNIARNAVAEDGSIAIRIPKDDFCQSLLRAFRKPITSTSANISGDPSPLTFGKISQKIKDKADLVVESRQQHVRMSKPSSIIKINADGDIQIVRS
jgi:L-threonylcarbamoyladenylate synthase